MYSRKIALSLAKQYRNCPPLEIRKDPFHVAAWKKHRTVCPYCSAGQKGGGAAWDDLSHAMKRIYASTGKTGPPKPEPAVAGQLRHLKPAAGVWRDHYFYLPPMVLVVEGAKTISGAFLVAQTYHDLQLAGPGDLIPDVGETSLGAFFIECWNTYTVRDVLLGPVLDRVSDKVVEAVMKCGRQPEFCPEWAMMPRPLVENDPRIFFRELELEVAHTFCAPSVSQIMAVYEQGPEKPCHASPKEIRKNIARIMPGTVWKRKPSSAEEALVMAMLPPEALHLAAAADDMKTGNANLVRMAGENILSLAPVPMEIHGQSGSLILSGRILSLPENSGKARFICFLEPEDEPPIPPTRCEWQRGTGDFLVEFQYTTKKPWRLKAAVVYDSPRE